jgi:formylglycine-generating enzyme required for sulfatase activity
MGSREEEFGRIADETLHFVTLSKGFWMGAHEVTLEEYLDIIGNNPTGFGSTELDPVENVTWLEAATYCDVLTIQERDAGRIPATWSYRLPTEAEWEYTCRAGARTTRFWFSDSLNSLLLDSYAWYNGTSSGRTHITGTKLPNPWGLCDMHGNVFEWCLDWYAPYPSGPVTDPKGPESGIGRVFRGGSWLSNATSCRSAARFNYPPGNTDNRFGFRVVLSPNP